METYTKNGHKDLARDPLTNNIVNVNKASYDQYIANRKVKSEKNRQIQTIEDEVASIKDDINDIKSLLKELIHGPK